MIDTSKRDKSRHPWAQGDGGVRQWIHHLTEPGELIVDPSALDRLRYRGGWLDDGAGRGAG